MAIQGVNFELTEENRKYAERYVEESGFYKKRLADFLGISRPTLDKLLNENPDFFTSLKRADSIFCKNLIDIVSKKNPIFILKTRYKEEFNDIDQLCYPDILNR
ncbi:hypothetical protein ACFLZP_01275 [Patescibacteria group bacterium]